MPSKKKPYSVSLTIGDKELVANGNSILEALDTFKPELVKSKAILRVTFSKQHAELLLYPFQLKRLMVNKTFRIILDKRLNAALK